MRKTLVAGALALAATVAPATASAQDRNHDRIPDRWERAYHLSLRVDQSKRDQDHDGLRNRAEWLDHTSPRASDTNGNGVGDAHEDADHDGVPNADEQRPAEPPHGDTPTPPVHDGADAPGHVVSYQQSPGFGGYLTLERANGERVTAYLGEKTDLECAASAGAAFAPCTKEHLVAGTPVAAAEHGSNGHADVWTKVYLLAGDGSVTPPPPTTPPPSDEHSAGGTVVSYEQSQYFGGVLTLKRSNGESVAAWYGDGTDLRCAPAAGAEYAPCSKAQLQAGTVVTDARHAVNAGGHDVWTRVYLIVPGLAG
jgi:hypothetical protein